MVKKVLDEFGVPKIQEVDILNYNIRNILEAHLYTIGKDHYPELNTSFKDLTNLNRYPTR